MLSELHSLNLKICSHLIVASQLSSGWLNQTKTRQAGQANEQSMYSFVSIVPVEGSREKVNKIKFRRKNEENNNIVKLVIIMK
jgi:hypothetical protein